MFMKIMDFFKGNGDGLSSKRLAYIASLPVTLGGSMFLANKLIDSGHPELCVQLWNCFYFYSAFLGGFVSIEVMQGILEALYKLKFNKNDKNN